MEAVNTTSIVCPKCGEPLSETLAGPVVARIKAEAEASILEARKQAESALDAEKQAAKLREAALKKEMEDQQATALDALRKAAAEKAEADAALRIQAANEQTESYRAKLRAAEAAQLDLHREKLEFEDAKQRFELDKLKAVNEAAQAARLDADRKAQEDSAQVIQQLRIQLQRAETDAADLKRKLEQKPSQELQGEAAEVLLEERLTAAFRTDTVEPVKKGQPGGDILQTVNGVLGAGDGAILWERKNAQNWSNDWPAKAREDGRRAGACVVVIVSEALPKGVSCFWHHDSVWVCQPTYALGLSCALRMGIMEARRERMATEGCVTKAQALWQYVTGVEFRARVEAGMEAYKVLRKSHDQDRRATEKRWRTQEQALNRMVESLWGVAGDIQGLGGADIGDLEGPDSALMLEASAAAEVVATAPQRNGVEGPLDDIDWDAALAE